MNNPLLDYLIILADTVERIGFSVPFHPVESHRALICLEGHLNTLKQKVERDTLTEHSANILQVTMKQIFGDDFYTKDIPEFSSKK